MSSDRTVHSTIRHLVTTVRTRLKAKGSWETRQFSPVSQRGSEQTHVHGKWYSVVVGTALRNQRYKSTWGHLSRNDVYTLSVSTIYIVNVVFFKNGDWFSSKMLATDDDFRLWTFKKKKPKQTKCLEINVLDVRWLIKMTRFGFFLFKTWIKVSLRRLKK